MNYENAIIIQYNYALFLLYQSVFLFCFFDDENKFLVALFVMRLASLCAANFRLFASIYIPRMNNMYLLMSISLHHCPTDTRCTRTLATSNA